MPSLAHQGAAVGGDQARSFSAFSVLKGDFGILSSHGGSSHLPQRLDRAMAAAKDNFFGQLAHDGTQAQREGQQQQRASIVELIHAAVLQLPPAERESLLPLSFQLKAAPAEEETLVMQRWNERVTRLMVSDPPPPAEVDQSLRQLMKLLINLHQLGAQPRFPQPGPQPADTGSVQRRNHKLGLMLETKLDTFFALLGPMSEAMSTLQAGLAAGPLQPGSGSSQLQLPPPMMPPVGMLKARQERVQKLQRRDQLLANVNLNSGVATTAPVGSVWVFNFKKTRCRYSSWLIVPPKG